MRATTLAPLAFVLAGCMTTGGYSGPLHSDDFLTSANNGEIVIRRSEGGDIARSLVNLKRVTGPPHGHTIRITGHCGSSCALALAPEFSESVCWSANAVFHFHGAYSSSDGAHSEIGTWRLWHYMPAELQLDLPPWEDWRRDRWFTRTGYELHRLLGRGVCTKNGGT